MKNKKNGIIISIVAILAALGYLAFGNFSKNLVYFYTPSELLALSQNYDGKKIRIAGMVVAQSVKMTPNTLKIAFQLTDGRATIPVDYEGVPPDLFKEGQGAVAEGHWDRDQKRFYSKMIMAKHSEDYMPIEMKEAGVTLPKKDFLKTLHME